ncbi:MAG: hypothetical protein GWN14_00025 [candidate division Zixibacteria bacterium]|nr:hypothetical protein [Gammaproteobacteria bacterium]NIX54349.1 hypothetical protein [candidate division Zixibacteria bacterium]
MKRWQFLMVLAGMFLLAGCSGKKVPPSEVYIIPNFGFSIDIPEGWYTRPHDNGQGFRTFELEADYREIQDKEKMEGIVISLEHRSLDWLNRELGLPEDPTLNDLFQMNIDNVTYMVNPTIEEITLFGVDAIKAEAYGAADIWGIMHMGIIEDEAFLLLVLAPSEEALEEFKPTWEAMVESIKPVEE